MRINVSIDYIRLTIDFLYVISSSKRYNNDLKNRRVETNEHVKRSLHVNVTLRSVLTGWVHKIQEKSLHLDARHNLRKLYSTQILTAFASWHTPASFRHKSLIHTMNIVSTEGRPLLEVLPQRSPAFISVSS